MQTHGYRLDLFGRRKVHNGHGTRKREGVFAIDNNRCTVGVVGEVRAAGRPSSLVADVGVLTANHHAVGNVAHGDLSNQPGRRGSQVDHAKRVRSIQRNIGALAVTGKRNASRIDGLRIVVRTTIGGRLRETHPLFVAEQARLPVHARDHYIVIVLAEEQL